MSKWVKVAAIAVAAVGVVVLIYAVLTPSQDAGTTDHEGMWGMHGTYSSQNVGLVAISIIVIVISLMIVALWRDYEPLPPSMVPPPPTSQGVPPAQPLPAQVEPSDPAEAAAHNYLVLRLLTGDERTMYKAIMDSGGEALQKDLIQHTKMSNAKVSRILDRLSEKDVVTKERYGATNKVRIKPDR